MEAILCLSLVCDDEHPGTDFAGRMPHGLSIIFLHAFGPRSYPLQIRKDRRLGDAAMGRDFMDLLRQLSSNEIEFWGERTRK